MQLLINEALQFLHGYHQGTWCTSTDSKHCEGIWYVP